MRASDEPLHSNLGYATTDEEILCKVVTICSGRIRKHTSGLLGELKNAQCREVSHCEMPSYTVRDRTTEFREDVALLGPYDRHNHNEYANLVQARINTLRAICCTISPQFANHIQDFCQIVRLAYMLQQSSLFRYWLQKNLCLRTKQTTISSMVDDIVKRVGKLSRFFRAVLNIARFTRQLARKTIKISVTGLQTKKVQVPELQDRMPSDLRARAGPLLNGCPDGPLRDKLQRWARYRVHAEVQLLIYYEQHHSTKLATNYIGGDKLCCYLCYQFITTHGRFEVNGCHQSLYSLWMVPQEITGLTADTAVHLHNTLADLCSLLQTQVSKISRLPRYKTIYCPQRESCDNLSRMSFATDFSIGRHLYSTIHPNNCTQGESLLAGVHEAPESKRVDELEEATLPTDGMDYEPITGIEASSTEGSQTQDDTSASPESPSHLSKVDVSRSNSSKDYARNSPKECLEAQNLSVNDGGSEEVHCGYGSSSAGCYMDKDDSHCYDDKHRLRHHRRRRRRRRHHHRSRHHSDPSSARQFVEHQRPGKNQSTIGRRVWKRIRSHLQQLLCF